MNELICIVCPRGCHLKVSKDMITGNQCPRGIAYAEAEMTDPRRTLTTTVKIINSNDSRCPVKSIQPIPKKNIFQAMNELKNIEVKAPVHIGEIVSDNICGIGIAMIVTKDILKGEEK